MKWIRILAIVISVLTASSPDACTIFQSDHDTQIAHNVDWFSVLPNVKGMVVLNPSRMYKRAELYGAPEVLAEWISQYKSMTFSIAGAEFPVAGFNEKQLFMAVLMLDGTKYPLDEDKPLDQRRKALSTTQFVQYNLDNSSTVEEVIASVSKVRPFSPSLQMHYFVCDATRNCAVIQYLKTADGRSETKIFTKNTLPHPVLTNSAYVSGLESLKTCDLLACKETDKSLWRFDSAVLMRSAPPGGAEFLGPASEVLNYVAQAHGDQQTRFQLIYNPEKSAIHVRKGHGPEIKFATVKTDFSKLKFDGERKVISIEASTHGVHTDWKNLTPEMQYELALGLGQNPDQARVTSRYPFDVVKCAELLH